MLNRKDRQKRIRGKISGTNLIPRVNVFRSNCHLYVQAIDDEKGITLASASDLKGDLALQLAKFAKDLQSKKIKKIVFDRGGYQYHGQVKLVAENLRKAGLEF